MPLESAAPGTPGFSRNVEAEVKAGKPVAQAVAIAYSKSGERKMDRLDAALAAADSLYARSDAMARGDWSGVADAEYNPEAIQKAIQNNRTGKIGGREGKMIHALLKGSSGYASRKKDEAQADAYGMSVENAARRGKEDAKSGKGDPSVVGNDRDARKAYHAAYAAEVTKSLGL